eukprot:gene11302-18939_t
MHASSLTASPSLRGTLPRKWVARAPARRLGRVQAQAEAQASVVVLPRNVQEQVDQAAETAKRASADGRGRQMIEMINPVNEKAMNFLSTEAFMGEELEMKLDRIDEGGIDGDLCGIITSPGLAVACIVFPTAERLKQIKKLAEDKRIKNLFIINPQWKLEGNLVSELGIGPWRKANEEFLATFEASYAHYEQRIGAPSSAIGSFKEGKKPSYKQLEAMIDEGRRAKLEIFRAARIASNLDITEKAAAASLDEGDDSTFYTRDQVLNMDIQRLRRVLMRLELPSSGTIQRLQTRCLAVADAVAEGDSLEAAVQKSKALR